MPEEVGKIGILAIQGSVEEHAVSLQACGVSPRLVRKPADLQGLSGLIIPGGESTTIGKLMWRFGLAKAILARAEQGDLLIWGTCAGAILLAKELSDERVEGLKLMDIEVQRNAYGNQLESFETNLDFKSIGTIDAVFIRAPKIVKVGRDVEVLAEYDGEIVAARDGNFIASTFHPEMTDDIRVHQWFVKNSEIRIQKSEIRDQNLELRSQK